MAHFVVHLQGGLSEKEAEIRASVARLDEAAQSSQPLSADDLAHLRRQLEDSSVIVREQQDKSKQIGEENELLLRRRDELEQRLATLEQEYEELLGMSEVHISSWALRLMLFAIQTKRSLETKKMMPLMFTISRYVDWL